MRMQAVPPIHIIVDNGKVTLEGVVANEADKNMANVQANGVSGRFLGHQQPARRISEVTLKYHVAGEGFARPPALLTSAPSQYPGRVCTLLMSGRPGTSTAISCQPASSRLFGE